MHVNNKATGEHSDLRLRHLLCKVFNTCDVWLDLQYLKIEFNIAEPNWLPTLYDQEGPRGQLFLVRSVISKYIPEKLPKIR